MTTRVVVVGAGLAGSLMATYLARRGIAVEVVERRRDPREPGATEDGRSINLGLSARGLRALREVDLHDAVLKRTVPMRGRVVHRPDGPTVFQPYGTTGEQILHSILRHDLNVALVGHAAAHDGVRFRFGTRFVGLRRGGVEVTDERTGAARRVAADAVVGADGAFSAVRRELQAGAPAELDQEFLEWGYKELSIPPSADGSPRAELEALHVWPGERGLIVTHPNQDGSHTGTVFLPHQGPGSFAELDTPERVRAYFAARFPDTLALMPDLVADFGRNPVGALVTIRTSPWHRGGEAVLLGDAAHAVYPFYGQGMNAAFEDCRVLDGCLGRHPADLGAAFAEFEALRKPHTDVLAALSTRNFLELRDGVRSPVRRARVRADLVLNRLLPDTWVPLYTLVSHTDTPYAEALARSRRQDLVLRAAGLGAAGLAAVAARRAVRGGR